MAFVLGEGCRRQLQQEELLEYFIGISGILLLMLVGLFLLRKKRVITNVWIIQIVVALLFLTMGMVRMEGEMKKEQRAKEKIEKHTNAIWCGKIKKVIEKEEKQTFFVEVEGHGEVLLKVKTEQWEEKLQAKDWIDRKIFFEGIFTMLEVSPNDGGFDEKEYYRSLGIYAKMENAKIQKVYSPSFSIKIPMAKLQAYLSSILKQITKEKEGGILQGILLGDKSEIDIETKFLYQRNGISHILAISGLHISILGVTWYRILRKRFGYGVSGGSAMSFVILFGIMVGNGSATLRAIFMLGILLFGEYIGRTYDGLTAIGFTLFIMLWQTPYYILNQGFWLSIGAMVGIYLIYPVIRQLLFDLCFFSKKKREGMLGEKCGKFIVDFKKKIAENFWFSFSIQIATLPIICNQYYVIPVYGIFLNLIVLPVFSLLVGVSFLAVFLGTMSIPIGTFFMFLPESLLVFYEWLCTKVLQIPGAIFCTGMVKTEKIYSYYAMLMICLSMLSIYGRKRRKIVPWWYVRFFRRGLLLFSALSIFCSNLLPENKNFVSVSILDVGQGDGIVIETKKRQVILIDGGSSSVSNLAKYRLIPFLLSHGYQEVESVFLSHMDQDHINGIIEILEDPYRQIKIKKIYLSDIPNKQEEYQKIIKAAQGRVTFVYLKEKDRVSFEDVSFEMQYPFKNKKEFADENEKSMVLKMKYLKVTGLFTGDAQASYEETYEKEGEKIDFLKIAHHGSKNATSAEFLKIANPKIAFVSAGVKNRYGHPSKEVLDRLKDGNVLLYNTQDCGQITMKITPRSEFILTKKQEKKNRGFDE